jgi:hypothetical protein
MTYVGIDGVVRHDQYPIHGDTWQHLGYEPIEPLRPECHPTIAGPRGPIVIPRLGRDAQRIEQRGA